MIASIKGLEIQYTHFYEYRFVTLFDEFFFVVIIIKTWLMSPWFF